jgi:ABC-type antimicrobial peptide transport system permease subunit
VAERNQRVDPRRSPRRNISGQHGCRSSQKPESLTAALRQVVENQDSNLPIFDLKTMEKQIDESVFTDRVVSSLSAVLGLLATSLAAVGLYGVLSYSVSRRTSEIGIRMALGANQTIVLGLVLREGIALIGVGVVCGSAAAFAISRLIANLLYHVNATDPMTFQSVSALQCPALTISASDVGPGWTLPFGNQVGEMLMLAIRQRFAGYTASALGQIGGIHGRSSRRSIPRRARCVTG